MPGVRLHGLKQRGAQRVHVGGVEDDPLEIVYHRAFQAGGRHGAGMLPFCMQALFGAAGVVPVFHGLAMGFVAVGLPGHGAAAAATVNQAGQQVKRFCRIGSGTMFAVIHFGLHLFKFFGGDDLRHAALYADPFAAGFEVAAICAAVWIGWGQAIPDISTGVLFVAQYIVQAVFAKGPPPAGDVPCSVECVYNFRIAAPLPVHSEDHLHGRGFGGLQNEFAGGFVHCIAQGRRAAGVAGAHRVFTHALHHFGGQVGAVPLVDGLGDVAHELTLRGIIEVFTGGQDTDALAAQLRFDQRLAFRIAEKAVEFVHDDELNPGGYGVL